MGKSEKGGTVIIRRIQHYADVMFSFPPKLRYFAEVEAANGELFCAYEGENPVGIVCLRRQGGGFGTAYLYVREERRWQGIATCLMRHAADFVTGQGKALYFRVLERGECAPACARIADTLSFRLSSEAVFFSVEVNPASKHLWEEYRPKLVEGITRVERKTGPHQITTFADAGEVVLEQLKKKIGTSLPGYLDPFALPDFSPEYSLIVMRKGEPIAFHAARVIGQKMISELSSAERGRTLLPAGPVFFDRLFDSDIQKLTCIVNSGNAAGMNHVRGRFGFLFRESNRQTVYIIQGNRKEGTH
jgi:GNAT superfamily N-acetyltransferase